MRWKRKWKVESGSSLVAVVRNGDDIDPPPMSKSTVLSYELLSLSPSDST